MINQNFFGLLISIYVAYISTDTSNKCSFQINTHGPYARKYSF